MSLKIQDPSVENQVSYRLVLTGGFSSNVGTTQALNVGKIATLYSYYKVDRIDVFYCVLPDSVYGLEKKQAYKGACMCELGRYFEHL